MPIYEYRCADCGRRSTHLVMKTDDFVPVCKHCSGTHLTRLISRVALLRSEEDRLERFSDPSRFGSVDEDDPRAMARWMKQMGQEMGEDVGEDFDQVVEEAMEEEYGQGAKEEDI